MDRVALKSMADQKFSLRDIAHKTNSSYSNVRYWIKKLNIVVHRGPHGKLPGSRDRKCEKCKKDYIYNPQKGHGYRFCNACVLRRRHRGIKLKIVELMGGKCLRCGYNKSVSALQLHHIRGDKDLAVSQMYNRSWSDVLKELEKCTMLCANCHFEVHAESRAASELIAQG